ncbi:MAG: hypothetical protein MK135_07440 [Polyangiaceae bacterium]|nr:hypothetical protein [Polyangiaceae bacterium]
MSKKKPARYLSLFCRLLFCCGGISLAACSSVKIVKRGDSTYFITCDKGMKDCISRANRLCEDDGYTIVDGAHSKDVLGGPTSSYQSVVFHGTLTIMCGDVDLAKRACAAGVGDTTRVDPDAPQVSELAPAERVCVPGASQGCIGVGGCQGGQSCLSDGSGFGRCDCGSTPPSAGPAASGPPAATSASAPPVQAGEPPAAEVSQPKPAPAAVTPQSSTTPATKPAPVQ